MKGTWWRAAVDTHSYESLKIAHSVVVQQRKGFRSDSRTSPNRVISRRDSSGLPAGHRERCLAFALRGQSQGELHFVPGTRSEGTDWRRGRVLDLELSMDASCKGSELSYNDAWRGHTQLWNHLGFVLHSSGLRWHETHTDLKFENHHCNLATACTAACEVWTLNVRSTGVSLE